MVSIQLIIVNDAHSYIEATLLSTIVIHFSIHRYQPEAAVGRPAGEVTEELLCYEDTV